jgi:hypothetical protein
MTVYAEHRLATPFLNWTLSEPVFRHPEFYENVVQVFHALQQDPPALIIDPENLMKPFFDRMPLMKKQYVREGNNYTRIKLSSN